jgi:hypothetical protein
MRLLAGLRQRMEQRAVSQGQGAEREERERGNTVFVDHSGTPYADQWALLASMRKIEASFESDDSARK